MTAPSHTITPADFAKARTLVAERIRLNAELARLDNQYRAATERDKRESTFRHERLDFQKHPARVAGIAELWQRNPPNQQNLISIRYHWLLRWMIDPPPHLEPGFGPPKPLQVDFHALPRDARPYLLGPYLGLHQGMRFAEVCLKRSRPTQGHIIMIQTGGPVDTDLWRAQLPKISAWLGGEWTITTTTASEVALLRRDPMLKEIPYDRCMLRPGALFVGIDTATRLQAHIPFSELSSGTYIPGAAGTGKTSALHVLLRSIFANIDLFAAVFLVDGKDGVAMARYDGLHPKIRVLYDEPDVWQLAANINATMRERNAQQRALGIDKATRDFIAVVIDELPTFIAKPATDPKKEHAAFLENMNRIAMRGRSAGIRMFLITQSPVAEQIPVPLRTNCATTIAFRLPEPAHATALFGTLDATNDPRKLSTGQAIVRLGETGKLMTVQFPFAPLWNPRKSP